jgi:A/G-specific adenine glycosylase
MNPISRLYQENGLNSHTISAFQKEIYQYYSAHCRDFPWRKTANPYHILVSEIMLQQTQTSRVTNKYTEFIAEFTDFHSLSNASLAKILEKWQGLGYNRRALALKKTADLVVTKYHGFLPESEDELKQLPGIGKYTVAAVMAFAYNKPALVIDTNVRTVYIHFFFQEQEKITDIRLLPFIEATMDKLNPRNWYSALFDYGAMLKQTVNLNGKSAHYHKQSRFNGSNRQIRSDILKMVLSEQAVSEDALIQKLGLEPEKITANINALHKEGFIIREKGMLYISR